MNERLVPVLLFALFALACGALWVGWMRRRLGLAAAILFGVALGLWVLAVGAIASGLGDADSFAVCGAECSGVHYSVVVGFLAPPLLIALAALAGIVALEQRRRARRAQ